MEKMIFNGRKYLLMVSALVLILLILGCVLSIFLHLGFLKTSITILIPTIIGVVLMRLVYIIERDKCNRYNQLVEQYDNVIEDPAERWEKNLHSHPKSLKAVRYMADLDFEYGDILCIKYFGDGDNGQRMTLLLDSFFEKEDLKREIESLKHS